MPPRRRDIPHREADLFFFFFLNFYFIFVCLPLNFKKKILILHFFLSATAATLKTLLPTYHSDVQLLDIKLLVFFPFTSFFFSFLGKEPRNSVFIIGATLSIKLFAALAVRRQGGRHVTSRFFSPCLSLSPVSLSLTHTYIYIHTHAYERDLYSQSSCRRQSEGRRERDQQTAAENCWRAIKKRHARIHQARLGEKESTIREREKKQEHKQR